MRGEPPVTAESGLQTTNQMSVLIEKLAAMKIPDAKIWEPYVSSLKTGIETERNMLEHYVSHVKSGKSPDSFQQQYINPEDGTLVDESGLVDMIYAATWFNVALNQYTKEIQFR